MHKNKYTPSIFYDASAQCILRRPCLPADHSVLAYVFASRCASTKYLRHIYQITISWVTPIVKLCSIVFFVCSLVFCVSLLVIQVGYEDARYSVNEGDGEVELCVTTQRPVMRPFVIISTTMDLSAGIQICCQNEEYALCLSL